LDKVNNALLAPGCTVLFKRGETWWGQLIPQSGLLDIRITYAAYGSGAKPLLHGSQNLSSSSDWIILGVTAFLRINA